MKPTARAEAGRPGHKGRSWVLHTNRDQRADGSRQTADPHTAPAPAPALTAKSGGQWVVKSFRNDNNNNNACERSIDEPAGTLFFGRAVQLGGMDGGTPVDNPDHRPETVRPARGSGESHSRDSVRLRSGSRRYSSHFPPDYPWQGTKTARFRQSETLYRLSPLSRHRRWPPDTDWRPTAEQYSKAIYGHREAA